jgi:hypothetical protein
MIDQLDHVAVGVVDVGVVLAGVLAAPLMGIGAADVRPASGRRPHVRDTQPVQVGEHGLPVVHLQREMIRRGAGRMRSLREVNLAAAEAQLQLPCIEGRTPIQELRAEYLHVPVPGSRSIADLDVDVMDELDPGHGTTSVQDVSATT